MPDVAEAMPATIGAGTDDATEIQQMPEGDFSGSDVPTGGYDPAFEPNVSAAADLIRWTMPEDGLFGNIGMPDSGMNAEPGSQAGGLLDMPESLPQQTVEPDPPLKAEARGYHPYGVAGARPEALPKEDNPAPKLKQEEQSVITGLFGPPNEKQASSLFAHTPPKRQTSLLEKLGVPPAANMLLKAAAEGLPPGAKLKPFAGALTAKVAEPRDPFPGHTITPIGADEHQGWAGGLARTGDFRVAVPTFARAVADYGDQGRGDVADVLGRLGELDPAKAADLQGQLAEATGEHLPFRLAPFGEGFDGSEPAPKVPEALTVPGGDNPFADRGHSIDEEGIQAHDRMAEAWAGTTDFGDVPGQLGQVIQNNGDQGRGDVADLLSRLHQRDPASAAHLQDAIDHAGGGRVPFADGEDTPEGEQLAYMRNPWEKRDLILEGGFGGAAAAGTIEMGKLLEALGKSAVELPELPGNPPLLPDMELTLPDMPDISAPPPSQPAPSLPPNPGLDPSKPGRSGTDLTPPQVKIEGYGTPIIDPERPNILIFPAEPEDPDANIIERRGNAATKADMDRWRDELLRANPGWTHVLGGREQETGKELKEYHIPGRGVVWNNPHPGGGYTDMTFQTPDGRFVHVQTVDVDPRTGKPTSRELENAERIRRLLDHDFDKDDNKVHHDVVLVPKRWQLKSP
jgi:hypothetical protein